MILEENDISDPKQVWELVRDFFVIKFLIGIFCGLVTSFASAVLFRSIGVHMPFAHVQVIVKQRSEHYADSSDEDEQEDKDKTQKEEEEDKDEVQNPTFEAEPKKPGSNGAHSPSSPAPVANKVSGKSTLTRHGSTGSSRVWIGSIPLGLAENERRLKQIISEHGVVETLTVRVKKGVEAKSGDESWALAIFASVSAATACVSAGLIAPGHHHEPARAMRVRFADLGGDRLASSHTLQIMLDQQAKQVASTKQKGELETIVFFIMSIASFYSAEALGSSGIIGAWICGLATRNWTYHNLTKEGQQDSMHFLGIMADISTNFVMLWIGLAAYVNAPGHCLAASPA